MNDTIDNVLGSTFLMMAFAVLFYLAIFSPILCAVTAAWRRRRIMEQRTLFIFSVLATSYGFITLFILAVALPVAVFAIYFVPALKEQGYFKNSVFLAILDFCFLWWWLLAPLLILVSGIVTTRYLSNRWNNIVKALHG